MVYDSKQFENFIDLNKPYPEYQQPYVSNSSYRSFANSYPTTLTNPTDHHRQPPNYGNIKENFNNHFNEPRFDPAVVEQQQQNRAIPNQVHRQQQIPNRVIAKGMMHSRMNSGAMNFNQMVDYNMPYKSMSRNVTPIQSIEGFEEESSKPSNLNSTRLQADEEESSTDSEISCLDVAAHTADCEICKKMYQTDLTPYIIIIALLSLILLLLIKKVLKV